MVFHRVHAPTRVMCFFVWANKRKPIRSIDFTLKKNWKPADFYLHIFKVNTMLLLFLFKRFFLLLYKDSLGEPPPLFFRKSWFDKALICTTCDFTQVNFQLLRPNAFPEDFFFKIFNVSSYVKSWAPSPIVAQSYPGDHDLNKLESKLHEDLST